MYRAALTGLVLLALALGGCATTATEPAAPAMAQTPITTTTPAPPTSPSPAFVPVASLPLAAPIDTWVVKGSDFQQTMDLRIQTRLIGMGVAAADATPGAARDLAYYVCSGLRENPGTFSAGDVVRLAYPDAGQHAVGMAFAAQDYCRDTI